MGVPFVRSASATQRWPRPGGGICFGEIQARNKWVWVNTYRYIFSRMNILLPASLGFTRYQGFDPSPNDNHSGFDKQRWRYDQQRLHSLWLVEGKIYGRHYFILMHEICGICMHIWHMCAYCPLNQQIQ